MTISDYLELKYLDMVGGTAFTAPAACYVKLHIGDPGEAGTANAAGETTRKVITFAAASAGSKAANGTLPSWTSVSTTETYSHVSLWDASTAGNCLWSGALSSSVAVTAGDTFTLSALKVSLD